MSRSCGTGGWAHHRSLNGEIIVCLLRALSVGPVDPATWLRDVDAFRRRVGGRPLTRAEVAAARADGRA